MTRPCFHKLILPSTIQEKRLRIPEKFVRKCRNEFSVAATLAVPDGRVWRIGLRRAENKIWFEDGWQDFLNFYSIYVGHFIVFRYEGNSSFSVYIFNLSTSEINYQSNALSSTGIPNHSKRHPLFEEMEDDDYEILGSLPVSQISDSMKAEAFNDCVSQLAGSKSFNAPSLQNLFSGSKMNNSMNWGTEANKVTLPCVDTETPKRKKPGRKKKKIDPNGQETPGQHEPESEMRFRFYESASARKRTVTAEERERAINAAKAFEPANPFCRVVLRPSYLYRGCIMYLPSCFAEKNLNGVSGFIKLQLPDGKQWPVRCLYRGGRAKFSQGWYEFCVENNLGEGDVCIFELIKSRDFVLKVTVFRVVESTEMVNRPPQ